MTIILKVLFILFLCINLNVNSNKKDYSKVVTYDTVDVLNQYEFNNYLAKTKNTVSQKGYYAPYYFKNLIDNFPVNSHGSCNYTAVAMLLSFYDTYWNDNVIQGCYEINSNLNSGTHPHNVYSPGVSYEENTIYSLSLDEYNGYIDYSYAFNFQSFLIKVSRDYGINTNLLTYGLNFTQLKNLIDCYLNEVRNIDSYSIITSYDNNIDPYYFAVDHIKLGIPVLLRIGNGTNNHTVIAYDYDDSTGEIFVHLGWKRNGVAITKIALSSTMYNQLYDAIVIVPNSYHMHTNNFIVESNKYCPCEFMYKPNNINIDNTTNYVDNLPSYIWDSPYKERWISQNDYNYKVSVKDSNSEIISSYFTESNSLEMNRPADWKELCENHTNYKIDVEFNYTGNDDLYGNLKSSKTFSTPTKLKNNPYLNSSQYKSLTSGFDVGKSLSYKINNNSFNVEYYRAMYNENDDKLMISSIGNGINYGYIFFELENEITRMDINLGIYEDSQYDLLTGNYRIRMYRFDENNNQVYLTSLVENIDNCKLKELPIGTENLELVTIYLNDPIDKFLIKFEYLGDSPSSLGKIAVGDIKFYKGQLPNEFNPLPLSGYELPYDPNYWNQTIIGYNYKNEAIYLSDETNCYGYALNNFYIPGTNDFFGKQQPGEYFDKAETSLEKSDLVIAVANDFKKYNENFDTNLIFIPISKYDICPIGTYKIALLADNEYPSMDYHFYRQNSDGSWSHKLGALEVRKTDNSNNVVYDPELCDNQYEDRLNYILLGFYAISPWNCLYEEA